MSWDQAPETKCLTVGSRVTLSHLGVTAIEDQETLPGDMSSHQIPPAGLPDANSIGGEWVMPKEWINLTDTQTWMLFDGSFYKGRRSDWGREVESGTSVSCHGDLSALIF